MLLIIKKVSPAIVRSLCEAVVLVAATLMLIGFYLYASGSAPEVSPWLILSGIVIAAGCLGSVAASYHQIGSDQRAAGLTWFRISPQLTETLKAQQAPADVIAGLDRLVADGYSQFEGETHFVERLEQTIGLERTKEVSALILKYAKVRPLNGSS